MFERKSFTVDTFCSLESTNCPLNTSRVSDFTSLTKGYLCFHGLHPSQSKMLTIYLDVIVCNIINERKKTGLDHFCCVLLLEYIKCVSGFTFKPCKGFRQIGSIPSLLVGYAMVTSIAK